MQNSASIYTLESGCATTVFIPSVMELGGGDPRTFSATLDYFKTDATNRRIGYTKDSSTSVKYWTRSWVKSNYAHLMFVNTNGATGSEMYTNYQALRPTFIVDSSLNLGEPPMIVDADGDAITIDSSQILGAAKIATGSYVGAGATSKTLNFNFEPKFVVVEYEYGSNTTPSFVIAVNGVESVKNVGSTASNSDYETSLSWGTDSVTLSSVNALGALNYSNYNYHYIAIG